MGAFGTDSFLARPRRKTFLVDFVVRGMVMDTCSGSVPFPFSTFGIFLNLLISLLWIVASGLVACFGMFGCLVSMASVLEILGPPPLVIWLLFISNDAWVLILLTLMVAGLLLTIGDADDIALEMTDHPNVWTDGTREDFSSIGGFDVNRISPDTAIHEQMAT